MKLFSLISRYLLLSLNILLVFLSAFSSRIILPSWLIFSGRLHPILLHLPIGIICVVILVFFLRRSFLHEPRDIILLLLNLAAITAVFSALTGIFLSKEGGYDEALLRNHQWAGVAISVLSALLFWLYTSRLNVLLTGIFILVLLPVLMTGGHYGAMLTHGEDYLKIPGQAMAKTRIITDSTTIYNAVIEPILETKCYTCHNEKKAKGELIMTVLPKLLEGGKNGKIWVAGDPLNSHIIQRIQLEEEDKKHMPPRGKPQLNDQEKKLLYEWIRNGAKMNFRFVDYAKSDSFRNFAAAMIPRQEAQIHYEFPAASQSLITELQSPFLGIAPLSTGSPALRVDFFIREGFQPAMLKSLEKIGHQIVELNLSNMPLKDEDISVISKFENLEYLNINGSLVTGSNFSLLQSCRKLRIVSLSGSRVKVENLALLGKMKSIRKVFCWNIPVDESKIKNLSALYKAIEWDTGYIPDAAERLQLTPPLLKNNESFVLGKNDSIEFKHPMPGVSILYTVNGKDPDSIHSPVYVKALSIEKATIIKAIAVRPGWNTSLTAEFTFFMKGISPSGEKLLTAPDKSYPAHGIETLTDNRKGEISNLKSDWLAYRDEPFKALFIFDQPVLFHEIVVSTAKNIGAFVMPPQKIEILAGNDSLHMKVISSLNPLQPLKFEPDKIEAQVLPVNSSYRYIRVIATPVKKLPKWHSGKGEKAWIFLDEIFFN